MQRALDCKGRVILDVRVLTSAFAEFRKALDSVHCGKHLLIYIVT